MVEKKAMEQSFLSSQKPDFSYTRKKPTDRQTLSQVWQVPWVLGC